MRLSRRGRYGVRAMICLALEGKDTPVSIKQIAAREGIPVAFLEQLFFRLKKAGLVRSVRGPKGGFLLVGSPETIRALDIIEALGESIGPVECVTGAGRGKSCDHVACCASHHLWEKLGQKMREVLNNATLADMCGKAKELRGGGAPGHTHTFHI